MSGQVVVLTNQNYQSTAADTIIAGAGFENVSFQAPGALLFANGGSEIDLTGTASTATIVNNGALYIDGISTGSVNYTLFDDGAAGFVQEFSAGGNLNAGNGAVGLANSGGGTIWSNGVSMDITETTGTNSAPLLFDAGSSSSTVAAGFVGSSSSGYLHQQVTQSFLGSVSAFVGNEGTLYASGPGSATLAAGAGANTIVGAMPGGPAGAGQDLFIASTGNSSLIGGIGNNYFVLGSGADTVSAGMAANALILVDGNVGGADIVQSWSTADVIDLFGYGGSGVVSQQVVGGSLQLSLSDHTQITLTGVISISSAQLNIS